MNGRDDYSALKRLLFAAIAILLGVTLTCVGAEVALRRMGRTPWRPRWLVENEPTMHAPDAQVGWRPIPGSYEVPPYAPGSPATRMTLLADGTRWSGADGPGENRLAFVGCSFTQGWAISDDETFAWRLQRRYPGLRILNHGTGAYGTYQSLLVMEQLFAAADPPQTVLYGFIEQHEARNVAHPAWLQILAIFSKGGMISVPYCTLADDGSLIRHPPEHYPNWPLREHSALVAFLEGSYLRWRAGGRAEQGRAVTERLLLEMQRLSASHGARFAVVLLSASPGGKAHYTEFLQAHGIDFVDCVYRSTPDLQVPGNNMHPNGKMNARYAECIAAKLQAAGMLGDRPPLTTAP